MKVLTNCRGYYGDQGYSLASSHDLDKRRWRSGDFKENLIFASIGRNWEKRPRGLLPPSQEFFCSGLRPSRFSTSAEEAK